jgi:transposase-like protein
VRLKELDACGGPAAQSTPHDLRSYAGTTGRSLAPSLLFDEARSAAEAHRELHAPAGDYRGADPSAVAVIERDLDALITHLRSPSEHRKRSRTTELPERTFVEVRRRTEVIGRFPEETLALSLIWAVLDPPAHETRPST